MTALLVTCGQTPAPEVLDQPFAQGRLDAVDMYDLGNTDLDRHRALWLSLNSDQRELQRNGARIEAFLQRGGTLVFCGHVAWPFLPELREFVPLTDYRLADLAVLPVTPHPVFAGVDPKDLSFRKGVAGFYGRGHNPPPPGAVVLNAIDGGRVPVDVLYERPGGGRVLLHAGIDLWGYLDDETSAGRIARQLLDWSLGLGARWAA